MFGVFLTYLPYIGIELFLTAVICAISITLSAEFQKAKTAVQQEKFEFISNVWVGTRSGVLTSVLILWSPLISAMALHEPIRKLSPFFAAAAPVAA